MAGSSLVDGFDAFGFEASARGPLRVVAIERVRPNPRQPRRTFDAARLQQLADSIATCGLLSPPLVHELGDESYELVAGERRWRACQLLGWSHGRALLTEPDHQERIALARQAVAARWSVRQLEAAVVASGHRSPSRRGLPADMLDAADRWTEALRARTGHAMTVRATARGFQIDVGDQRAVRELLTRLGVAADDLDEV